MLLPDIDNDQVSLDHYMVQELPMLSAALHVEIRGVGRALHDFGAALQSANFRLFHVVHVQESPLNKHACCILCCCLLLKLGRVLMLLPDREVLLIRRLSVLSRRRCREERRWPLLMQLEQSHGRVLRLVTQYDHIVLV